MIRLQFILWFGRAPVTTVYRRTIDRVALMRNSAFGCIWLADYRFTTCSSCLSMTIAGTSISAHAERPRTDTADTPNAHYHRQRLKVAMPRISGKARTQVQSGLAVGVMNAWPPPGSATAR